MQRTTNVPPCPNCDSSSVVSIIYGEPQQEPASREAVGGCIVSPDSSRWACTKCRHRWGVASDYDFENLATQLELAIETTMWSRVAHHQWEALDVVRALLTAPGLSFIDDTAEAARCTVVAALGSSITEASLDALNEPQRDSLAEQLLHLLRFAERKAANG